MKKRRSNDFMEETMITTDQLEISFNQKKVLKGITFQVKKQEIFGFLGPSGAGKTTTIKLLTKQLNKDNGKCEVKASKKEIGILSDNSGAYERLTIYRNLRFFAELSQTDITKVEEVLKRVKLWEDKDKKVKDLSRGMKQRLLLAIAVIHSPKLLFLDEPTASLDPATTEEIHKLLLELKESGTTIFLTTHNMEEADQLCDRVAFLNKGQIVEIGCPSDLKLKYAIDEVTILFEDNTTVTTSKNGTDLIKTLEENKNKTIKSIHSQEPNLAEIFLKLTGGELK